MNSLCAGVDNIFFLPSPMIPGITDTDENLAAIEEIIGDSEWEKIPYNDLAGAKYENLGMKYRLGNEEIK